jgi:hypothetical protein
MSSQAYASHQLEKYCTFKTMSCQHPKICEISKGVSKPNEVSAQSHYPYKKCGNSFISLPFPHNALLESPVDLASCCKSRRPCSINSFSASQAEAIDMEILLSSQGSRIVSVKKSSIVYSFLVRASNPQNRTRKYAQDRSKLFAMLLLLLSRTQSVVH